MFLSFRALLEIGGVAKPSAAVLHQLPYGFAPSLLRLHRPPLLRQIELRRDEPFHYRSSSSHSLCLSNTAESVDKGFSTGVYALVVCTYMYVYTHTIRSSGQRVNKRVSHSIEECSKFQYTDANRILNCLYALLFLVNCILLPWGLVIIIFLDFVKYNKVYI